MTPYTLSFLVFVLTMVYINMLTSLLAKIILLISCSLVIIDLYQIYRLWILLVRVIIVRFYLMLSFVPMTVIVQNLPLFMILKMLIMKALPPSCLAIHFWPIHSLIPMKR